MVIDRRSPSKRLSLALASGVLVLAAFGAACNGFFVQPTLTSITVNPTAPTVQLGQTATLSAYGVNSNGQGSYLTSGVSWSSSNPEVATISGTGNAVLTGVSIGTTSITASSESVTNTASATVFITVSSLTISPTSQSLPTNLSTTSQPFVVTANGSTDISSSAVLTAYLSGTASTDVTCMYETSNPNGGNGGPGQYCSDDGTGTAGTYQVIATYTGTTLTATATLSVPAPTVTASKKPNQLARK